MSIPQTLTLILGDSVVRNALSQAWRDSQPGVSGGHEEGGFIIRNVTGELSVARWPKGDGDTITISRDTIYLITRNGDTRELTDTETYFEEE